MIAALLSFAQELVINVGYPGIVFVAALENFFPPLPSEMIFPFVGFVAGNGSTSLTTRGELTLPLVIAAGVLGTFVGALFWYAAGYMLGATDLKVLIARYGKPLGIKLGDIEKAERWFERYEAPAIFFGRLIPLVRTFVSIPAGFVRMNITIFSLLTVVGSTLWIGGLTYAGFILGERWEAIIPYLENYELAIEIVVVGAVILLLFKKLRR